MPDLPHRRPGEHLPLSAYRRRRRRATDVTAPSDPDAPGWFEAATSATSTDAPAATDVPAPEPAQHSRGAEPATVAFEPVDATTTVMQAVAPEEKEPAEPPPDDTVAPTAADPVKPPATDPVEPTVTQRTAAAPTRWHLSPDDIAFRDRLLANLRRYGL